MRIIPLYYGIKQQLSLDIKVAYGSKTFLTPVPSIIDTAAERSFLVPFWARRIARDIGPLDYGPDATPARTLLGDLQFRVVRGLELHARLCGGTDHSINDKNWVCVARAFWGKGRALKRVKVNLLGRDVLNNWTLYHNPRSRNMFLIEGQVFIDQWMQTCNHLVPYFSPGPPRHKIAPSRIRWLP